MQVHLQPFDTLDRYNTMQEARELVRARNNATNLEQELPYPYEGYKDFKTAYLRIRRIAKNAGEHSLRPYVIHTQSDKKRHTIGVATAQRRLPQPNPLPSSISAFELSYWHRDMEDADAIKVGIGVIRELKTRLQDVRKTQDGPTEKMWMVTLPDDALKQQICENMHMVRLGGPEVYTIEDGVDVARQLWTNPGNNPYREIKYS